MFSVSLIGTTKKKPQVDTQKRKRKESNYMTTKNINKSQRKKAREEQRNYKTVSK